MNKIYIIDKKISDVLNDVQEITLKKERVDLSEVGDIALPNLPDISNWVTDLNDVITKIVYKDSRYLLNVKVFWAKPPMSGMDNEIENVKEDFRLTPKIGDRIVELISNENLELTSISIYTVEDIFCVNIQECIKYKISDLIEGLKKKGTIKSVDMDNNPTCIIYENDRIKIEYRTSQSKSTIHFYAMFEHDKFGEIGAMEINTINPHHMIGALCLGTGDADNNVNTNYTSYNRIRVAYHDTIFDNDITSLAIRNHTPYWHALFETFAEICKY